MGFHAVETAVEADRERLARRRGHIERLLSLAEHLPRHERALVEAVYRDGRSLADIARTADQPAGRFERRLNAVARRMADPLFLFVVSRFDALPADLRPVARRVVLHGMSQRRAAEATGHSLHRVRTALQRLQGMCSAATTLRA